MTKGEKFRAGIEWLHVPLQCLHRPRRTDRRCHPAQPCARPRHDAAPQTHARSVARTEPNLCRIPEALRGSAEAGEGNPETAGGVRIGWWLVVSAQHSVMTG